MSDQKVLAQGLGEHCITGVKHTGEAVGFTEDITGVETYISKPPTQSSSSTYDKIILFFADVYGPLFINNKLLQDYFASRGFFVAGIDYFEGDPIHLSREKPNWNLNEWIEGKRKRADEILPVWVEAIKDKYGKDSTKYTAVGYCFGAPHVLNQAAGDLVVAGAIAHPAFINEEHFEKAKAPLFFSCAEVDHTFPLESRRRAEDILVAKKAVYTFQVFSGVTHGFAVRGDPNISDSRWAKEESATGIANWFERFSS